MTSKNIRVAIVEDDAFARETVATWLGRDEALRVVGEYARLADLLEALDYGLPRPAVCWFDLDFPCGVPVESPHLLWAAAPGVRVVASALAPRLEHAALWPLGLDGWVLKQECGTAAPLAVWAAAHGWRVATPGVLEWLPDQTEVLVTTPAPWPLDFPPHLQRVAYLRYGRYLTPEQIAEELVLSGQTVESYLKVIKQALGLDRKQLLAQGFRALRGAWPEPKKR